MTALPIEGYAREYTDANQLLADIAARKERLFPRLVLVDRASVSPPVRVVKPKLEKKVSRDEAIDIPNFLALRPKATEWLGDAPKATFRPAESTTILRIVSEHTGVSKQDIRSARRTSGVVRPRMIACWLMRHCTTLSLPVIGQRVGGRDHTTVLHAVRVIDALRAEGGSVLELTDTLRREVKQALAAGRDEDNQP